MVSTEAPGAVDVAAVLDRSPMGRFHWTTLALCFLCMVVDGFDIQALGYTAPTIVREWGVANAVMGPVFAAGNVGVLIGALVFSMAADRIGRRPVLIVGTVFFGLMTLLTARAGGITELLALRLVAGIGLGSIAPNVSALVAEYSPARHRATVIMIVGVGLTVGGVIGGFVSAALIPAFGWRAVFYLGGVIPLVIALLMAILLPESLPLMVLLGKRPDRLAAWANRIDPSLGATAATRFTGPDRRPSGVPILALFREGRGPATLLLWVANFMNLFNLYALSSWLPTLIREAGLPAATAVLVGATLQLGGAIGTFGLAWLVSRGGFVPTLGITFVIASLAIAAIGTRGLPLPWLYAVVFVAGWCVVGSQPGLNALSGAFYPTAMRSTGVGAGLGVGRIGAVVGPIIGGRLMAAQWTQESMFHAAATPALLAAAAIIVLGLALRKRTTLRPNSS